MDIFLEIVKDYFQGLPDGTPSRCPVERRPVAWVARSETQDQPRRGKTDPGFRCALTPRYGATDNPPIWRQG
jgi:hypothetical protein